MLLSLRVLHRDKGMIRLVFDPDDIRRKVQNTGGLLFKPTKESLFQLRLEDKLPLWKAKILRPFAGLGKTVSIIIEILRSVPRLSTAHIGFVQPEHLQCPRTFIVQYDRTGQVHRLVFPLKHNAINAVASQ